MSAKKLVLHHRYRDNVAYDWSRNNNHGHLVDVFTGDGVTTPNRLLFDGGPDRVEVRPSDSLRDFGELRIRVVFQSGEQAPNRRYNLVEGEYSFALFLEPNGGLMATVNSPSAGWLGPRSGPGVVQLNRWHTVDFLHDGVSRGRLYLDGALVAERFDMNGPIGNLGGRGVTIGHWPGDDRYTFIGQLDEVLIWKYDPHDDGKRVIDECCIDKDWIDQRIAEARRRGWTGRTARDSFAAFFGQGRAAAGEVRGGDPARIAALQQLTQQALNALAVRDATGLETTLHAMQTIVAGQLGPARMQQLGQQLWTALRATPVGDFMGQSDREAVEFFQQMLQRTCLDRIVPPRKGERPDRDKLPPGGPVGDPFTDKPPPPDPIPSQETVPDQPPPEPPTPPKPDERGAR